MLKKSRSLKLTIIHTLNDKVTYSAFTDRLFQHSTEIISMQKAVDDNVMHLHLAVGGSLKVLHSNRWFIRKETLHFGGKHSLPPSKA